MSRKQQELDARVPGRSSHSRKSIRRWGEKPYYSLDYYLKQTFGEKIYKIALDSGGTCPNRDGTLDTRGCIFCSAGGSGDFAATGRSITEQLQNGIRQLENTRKYHGGKYIAYFQSFSNTYAPVDHLRQKYEEAMHYPGVVGLSIATRPDCFSSEIYDLLAECHKTMPVWVELGLQTIHEMTARQIRRGYSLPVFETCVHELRTRGIPVIVHVILGLPGETTQDVLQTIEYLNHADIQGIKLQLLHILKGTDLAAIPDRSFVLSEDDYVALLLQCVGHLSPNIVIHRLTGDGPKELLLAPLWSLNKRRVLNHISHDMKVQQLYQGKYLEQKEGTSV